MFSQFVNAVENLAQQPRRSGSLGDLSDNPSDGVKRSSSRERPSRSSTANSGQLAESALQNLRKSLANQRATLNDNAPTSKGQDRAVDRNETSSATIGKRRLEDRLRASFTAPGGEASSTVDIATPSYTQSPSPEDIVSLEQPAPAPSMIPLPPSPSESPVLSPTDTEMLPLGIGDSQNELSPPLLLISSAIANRAELPYVDGIASQHPPLDAIAAAPSPLSLTGSPDMDVEGLRARLKVVEQLFTDMSSSFKRLQAERDAADYVLRELNIVDGIADTGSLRQHLQGLANRTLAAETDLRKLEGRHQQQEERMEELRDMHRLESHSSTEQMDKLRGQLEEAKRLLKASNDANAHHTEATNSKQADIDLLTQQTSTLREQVKEEEEKRVKAINLLKTVRARLVKAEKERDDAVKDVERYREQDKESREKEEKERQRLQGEADRVKKEAEKEIASLRARWERETAEVKERHEREVVAVRSQFELEFITAKATRTKELSLRDGTISKQRETLNQDAKERNSLLDQLQLRQAELESTRSHNDAIQGQLVELQYQLQQTNDRVALLTEELVDARSERDDHSSMSNDQTQTPSGEVARLLSAAEAKYETKIADMRKRLELMEAERIEAETEWNRRWSERAKEVEALQHAVGSSTKTKDERGEAMSALKGEVVALKSAEAVYKEKVVALQQRLDGFKELETNYRAHESENLEKIRLMDAQLQQMQGKETQLRTSNKALRDELRKVQSSAALLERQRNPGVGFWSEHRDRTGSATSLHSSSSQTASQGPSSRTDLPSDGTISAAGAVNTPTETVSTAGDPSRTKDEQVSLEYLRNVILQFLEHKEMRPNLVRVLSILLQFTPQETRRLIAKV